MKKLITITSITIILCTLVIFGNKVYIEEKTKKEAEKKEAKDNYDLEWIKRDVDNYIRQEKYDDALHLIKRSNTIRPTGKNSDSACTVYSAKGDFKEAIKWCKQAVDLGYEKSITGLGLVYNSAKDYDNAIIWLKKGDELKQDGAATSLGFAYNRLGNKEEAYKYYKKAVKDFPKSVLAVSNLIHFYHNDLKDNVKASAWAIAGVNNIFDALSVTELLVGDWEIPLEDLQKGYELQLTSDEFPYNYEQKERRLGMLHKSGYDERLESYRKKKQENNK
ncbi:Sel1 domain-containing protein [Aliarcobacter faecis]|uniref:tetratricopeptide repeat protein n=1 Tax=Aliarcobacter faecis TaxID=1564138 RepID=UPI00047ACA00|nr:tetratricopeptide repeat protein [Aliarcobacter faecis]QKF73949.1 Sel1 domain-containing protein [Aliarcobacter faecis]